MIATVQTLIDDYLTWLKEKTRLREIGEWVEITTPFLDRHNDALQIYARRTEDGYLLTDDGYIISDLRQSGCELVSPRRKEILRSTLNGFGVRLDGDAMITNASERDFGVRKHNLLQAMLAVNDLFFLATSTTKSLFLEDVEEWLNLSNVRFLTGARFTGKSGFDHQYDFVIPSSAQAPERYIETINNPSRKIAELVAFSWSDTREVRPEASRAYAVINDSERTPSNDVIEALRVYGVRSTLWSQRESIRQELAA